MATKPHRVGLSSLLVLTAGLLLAAGCAPRQAQAPPPAPPPKQNLVVLLPDPEGNPSSIAVTNGAGAQTLAQPYQAVRVERSDVAPSAPFAMDEAEVRRAFGPVLDALPAPEVLFTVYFDPDNDTPLLEDKARLPLILDAIRERKSTAVTVIGHTDTTVGAESNYQLGLRRAQRVAAVLRAGGVEDSSLSVSSHGDADLTVKTGRGVAERRNRRVEVVVR